MKIKITPEMRIRLAYAESVEIEMPKGWKLVPAEPTDEMRNAGRDAHCDAEDRIMREADMGNKGMLLRANRAAHVYSAMIAAAPEFGNEN